VGRPWRALFHCSVAWLGGIRRTIDEEGPKGTT
jgi:hypothetical protein